MIQEKSQRPRRFPLTESKLEVGFYLIVKIYKAHPDWKPEIEEWMADAYFKKTIDAKYEWNTRKIRLKPLFNEFSVKYELANYDNCSTLLLYLGVNIIEIKLLDVKDVFGNPYSTYSVNWKEFDSYEEKELHSILPESYDIYEVKKDNAMEKYLKSSQNSNLDELSRLDD